MKWSLLTTNSLLFLIPNCSVFLDLTEAQVQDFLSHSQGDISNSSQNLFLQQTCTLLVQSGVRLLSEFTHHAAAWANTSVVQANFSQTVHMQRHRDAHSGHSQGNRGSSKKHQKIHEGFFFSKIYNKSHGWDFSLEFWYNRFSLKILFSVWLYVKMKVYGFFAFAVITSHNLL